MSNEATLKYRAWKRKKLDEFQKAFGLTDAEMDEDERELLGKEEPSEEWMAAWSAATEK
jgi:hypothetical protein